jgi:hydroxypyruvate reductase
MANLTQLRVAAREIFRTARRAVDPLAAVRTAVRIDKSRLTTAEFSVHITDRRIYSIAIGKAAARMAVGLSQVLGPSFTGGILATNDLPLDAPPLHRWQIFLGGHPEPNEASLAAARASFQLLEIADKERALVIFLISGGGSAMIESPARDEISLSDLQAANKLLVNCGACISEVNAVRRAFSAVKGGKLAAHAPNCDRLTLIVSDVPDGEEYDVASGPTIVPGRASFDAGDVIDLYKLRSELPAPIVRAIDNPASPITHSASRNQDSVLLSNNDAQRAAAETARRHGFIVEIASDISDQPIEQGCRQLIERLDERCTKLPDRRGTICLISGGEFACPVTGKGIGGRNLETALRLALLNSSTRTSDRFVALCAGTDGIDGNSPAAGAIVDATTLDRARALNLNAERFLERSDSYSFFAALQAAITTGPTGTNVRDLRLLIASA